MPLQPLSQVRLFPLHTCVLTPTQTTSIRYLEPKSLLASSPSLATRTTPLKDDIPPPGTVKSILPCTPLGVVKCLERIGVYNALLPYGDRAYGRTITVINRCVPFPRSHHRDNQGTHHQIGSHRTPASTSPHTQRCPRLLSRYRLHHTLH